MPVRRPRCAIRINGRIYLTNNIIEFEVHSNSYFEADTFRVRLGISALPPNLNWDWFVSQTEIFVDILAGFPSNPDQVDVRELHPLIYGRVDEIESDITRRTMTLTGRDLTGALIDARVVTEYANQTSASIVSTIASCHGFSTLITNTKGYAGIPQGSDYIVQHLGSEWDLICGLARNEGFVARFIGDKLYFGEDITGSSPPLKLGYQVDKSVPSSNFESLVMTRRMTIVKGITVKAMSAGVKDSSVTVYYPSKPKSIAAGKATPYGATTLYTFKRPAGIPPVPLQKFAEEAYKSITAHAMSIVVTMPADLTTTPQSKISLSGTGTEYDQDYFASSVVREMDFHSGFQMYIEAKNSTPLLEAAADE